MIGKNEAGKGDCYRPVNKKVYDKNFNNIFHKPKINYEWIFYTTLRLSILLILTLVILMGCKTTDRDLLRDEYQRYNHYYDN